MSDQRLWMFELRDAEDRLIGYHDFAGTEADARDVRGELAATVPKVLLWPVYQADLADPVRQC